jgi:hypothetical protein
MAFTLWRSKEPKPENTAARSAGKRPARPGDDLQLMIPGDLIGQSILSARLPGDVTAFIKQAGHQLIEDALAELVGKKRDDAPLLFSQLPSELREVVENAHLIEDEIGRRELSQEVEMLIKRVACQLMENALHDIAAGTRPQEEP